MKDVETAIFNIVVKQEAEQESNRMNREEAERSLLITAHFTGHTSTVFYSV